MNPHKSRLCQGISISTGNPCRNHVVIGDFCRHHQVQISGKNKYGVPIARKNANNSKINLSQNNYCNGTTAESQYCIIRVKSNAKNFCHHHNYKNIENNNDKFSVETTDKLIKKSTSDNDQNVTHQCDGITKKGERCKNVFKYQGNYCHLHNKSAEELINFFVPGCAKQKYYSIDG
jgi:hypothetical protein